MSEAVEMKGEQINNLCKTLGIMDELIYMNEKVKVVDEPHVMLMEVERLDGSAVFGVTDSRLLDPKDIIDMKIEGKEEFDVLDEDNKYILRNENRYYSVPIIEDDHVSRTVKVPRLEGLLHKVEVSGKMLKDFMSHVPKRCNSVRFSVEDGTVWVKVEDCNYTVGVKLATTDHDVNIKSSFDSNYMKKLVKVIGSTVTLGLETDYLMTAEWCDNYYKYKVLLAPRIERE